MDISHKIQANHATIHRHNKLDIVEWIEKRNKVEEQVGEGTGRFKSGEDERRKNWESELKLMRGNL